MKARNRLALSVAVLGLIAFPGYSQGPGLRPERREWWRENREKRFTEAETPRTAEADEKDLLKIASATKQLKEAVRSVSDVTSSLTRTDKKRDAFRVATNLLRTAADELMEVHTQEPIREANLTLELASAELRSPSAWDAWKVRGLLEKAIKQLGSPTPIQPAKPATPTAAPPLPTAQLSPTPTPAPQIDFFNLKKSLPTDQK